MKTKKELSDLARNNKVSIIAHTIIVSIMMAFCVLQATDGIVEWSYVIIAGAIGILPVIAELIINHRNKDTHAIKHLVAIGFA